MKSSTERSIQGVSLPGAGARQEWLFGPNRGSKLAEAGQLEPEKGAYLLGAKDVVFVPLWINTPDPMLWDKLVRMELEQLKLEIATEAGCVYQYRVVAEEGARRQMAAAVIVPEALDRLPEDVDWARYDLAAQYLPLPRDGMVICREENEWTLLFSKGGKLSYLHPLGRGTLDEDVMQEAFCISLRLREQSLVAERHSVHLWDRDPERDSAVQLLERWFGVAVERMDPPAPTLPSTPDRPGTAAMFEPPETARRRQRSQRRAAVVRALAAATAFYGAIVIGGWIYLHHRESALSAREAELAELMPDASRMQQIQGTWQELKDALEPDAYPWEIFHQCAVLLPSQGVRLTHFEINGPRLVVRGEASTTAQAIQYRNALLNATTLAQYQWESPKPEILPDNRAKFQAFGVIRSAASASQSSNETK